jgi:hypothetical protein
LLCINLYCASYELIDSFKNVLQCTSDAWRPRCGIERSRGSSVVAPRSGSGKLFLNRCRYLLIQHVCSAWALVQFSFLNYCVAKSKVLFIKFLKIRRKIYSMGSWHILIKICFMLFRYSGRTQKQMQEHVRENFVKRQSFQRWETYSIYKYVILEITHIVPVWFT